MLTKKSIVSAAEEALAATEREELHRVEADPVREHADIERGKELVRHMHDVDEVIAPQPTTVTSVDGRSAKLAHATQVARKTEDELRTLCEGLNARILQIGITVARAADYQGLTEKTLHLLGILGFDGAQHRADASRQARLRVLTLDKAVEEIERYVRATIEELGTSEREYRNDLNAYQQDLTEILKKLTDASPEYIAAKHLREVQEALVAAAESDLKAADEEHRPALESAYEAAKRALHEDQAEEGTMLAIVKEASEALPEVQKSRDAAAEAIQSLHSMRQSLFEKFSNFKVLLQRASTAMKARARIELYESADPAFNKSIDLITENNIATAGAALEVSIERLRHAAIDPQRSQELLNELLEDISGYARDLKEIEVGVSHGVRALPERVDEAVELADLKR